MKKMCIIGSLNIDLVASVDRFPRVGESVYSNGFEVFVGGGKGANQAVALGKLGADVRMVGKLGDRFYGPEYLEVLKKNNVACDTVIIEKDMFPGSAIVAVDKNGDNILIVNDGANGLVDVGFIREQWEKIADCDIFLLQQEIPAETNEYLIEKLHDAGKTVIFDPAPARVFPDRLLPKLSYITPNETELTELTGVTVRKEDDFRQAGRLLIEKGAAVVIAKAGKAGAYVITPEEFIMVPGFPVEAVDPTAAGDSFNAAFAFALARGDDRDKSIRFANAAAALSTTDMGAQSAMPTIDEVNTFLKTIK
jgi:ribokinase